VVRLCLLAAQARATKSYGLVGEVTDFERQTMPCREIALEQAKVSGVVQQIDRESQLDGRAVLSFLGDLGFGSVIEQTAARESAAPGQRPGLIVSGKQRTLLT